VPTQHQKYTEFKGSWYFYTFLLLYRFVWYGLLPFAIIYLLNKSKKEPRYRKKIAERFGLFSSKIPVDSSPIWIHAASMGELKAITPLIQTLLEQQHHLLITTLTPAGKQTAEQYFLQAIQSKQLYLSYAPLELATVVKRFIKYYHPRCALMAEIDSWPVLLTTLKKNKIPLGFINAQYPKKSFERDARCWGVRRELFKVYDLIACKSETHAKRFILSGQQNVHIVGEIRFDLPIPDTQINQANVFKALIDKRRPIITLASIVAAEEDLFVRVINNVSQYCITQQMPKPFWIIVPRSPQRFHAFHQQLNTVNIHLRSHILDTNLSIAKNIMNIDSNIDGILGDSLGEMYFYLQPAHCVIVGASFVPLGSHNIIEPIALKKPVIVGNSVWGIEYPAVEALAAGVLQQCPNEDSLVDALIMQCIAYQQMTKDTKDIKDIKDIKDTLLTSTDAYEFFYADHTGSTVKHLQVLQQWLNRV
jgi:3-deoxy-D-manno-octulosonic-acid transferase